MIMSLKLLPALLLATSFTVLGCNPAAAPAAASATQTETDSKDPASADSETGAEVEQGAPKIASDEATYDFGAIKPVESIEHVFKIKNEGSADLHIERVQKT